MSKSQITSFKDLMSRFDWVKISIALIVIISLLLVFSCSEEEIKVPVGCECNDGRKFDFSKYVNETLYPGIKYVVEHCDGGQVYTSEKGCWVTTMMPHGGLKRYIYNPDELK